MLCDLDIPREIWVSSGPALFVVYPFGGLQTKMSLENFGHLLALLNYAAAYMRFERVKTKVYR